MASINVRIDADLKKDAEKVFEGIGVSTSTAINMFFKQVVRTKKIPFELSSNEEEVKEIPNWATRRAFKEVERMKKKGVKGYTSIEELKKALER